MTSPVDTTVKYFSSLMSGAPALSGTAGAMVSLLDAVLKDGFDTKTLVSLIALGGVMTATFTGTHSAQIDSVVLIAGVTGGPTGFAGANGEQKVVAAPTTTTRTWATTLPDGTYTGTVTMKMAPLGFAKIFNATNVGAYQSTDPASTKMILRVDDTGTLTCRVVGCEQMTDINTYTGLFPTATQIAGGGYWPKSSAANTTANQWMLVGDSRAFYLHVCPSSGATPTLSQGFTKFFGDVIAFKPGGDAYACAITWSTNTVATAQTDGQPEYNAGVLSIGFARAPSGLGPFITSICAPYTGGLSLISGCDTTFGLFPNPIDGSLRVSKRYYAASTGVAPRAEAPGIYSVPHTFAFDSFKFGDRVPGSGLLVGKNLIAVNPTTSSSTSAATTSTTGVTLFDITGPWR